MGKKNKKPSTFDYFTGSGKIGKAMDRYGVSNAGFGGKPGEYGGGDESRRRMPEDIDKEIKEAARNDYDTRRTLEAAAMSGKGKAKDILDSGFKNIGDVLNAQNFMGKAAKRHGQGGDFSSGSDYIGLTQSMVERDRAKQTAAYDETYAKTTDLNSLKDKLMAQATEKAVDSAPIQPSDRMAAVEERLEGAAGNRPPSLFDKDNAQPAKADDQKDAARNFLDDYKLDVAEGANIKSDIETGVSNAAKHVRDTYGR